MVYIYICTFFFFFARAKNHYFSAARLSARRHRFNYKRPFDSNLNIKKDLSGSTSDGWRSGVCGGGGRREVSSRKYAAGGFLAAAGVSDSLLSMEISSARR